MILRLMLAAGLTGVMISAGRANAADSYALVKPGMTAQAYLADRADCIAAAQHTRVDAFSGLGPTAGGATPLVQPSGSGLLGPSIAGVVEDAVLLAAAEAYTNNRAGHRFVILCMLTQGYEQLPLTPGEAGAFAAAKGSGPAALWLQALAAKDLEPRLAAARASRVPVPPRLRDEPWAIGAARIDPASLKLAPGPVVVKGDVLTGVLAHRRTAVLQSDFIDHGVGDAAPAGTVFQALIPPTTLPQPMDRALTTWCAHFSKKGGALMRGELAVECVHANLAGSYDFAIGFGQPWLVATAGLDSFWNRSVKAPVVLVEQDHDGIGPVDFALVVAEITPTAVTLAATATREGKSVIFWRGALAFDIDGRAVLPCWTQRLVLTRAGAEGVTAALEPSADGRGWAQAGP